jgi:MYXO-CTERM domain-containing protein
MNAPETHPPPVHLPSLPPMKSNLILTAAALLAVATVAHAASVTETYGPFTPGTPIADNDPVLTPFLLSITDSAIVSLTQVEISFELRGVSTTGFASDLFASLIRTPLGNLLDPTDPAAVLLNRVGQSDLDPVGFAYNGWNITLSDSAALDIHEASLEGGVLTGLYQPDGRLLPTDVARPSFLAVFVGLGGNGDWRLNLGDLAPDFTLELVSWELKLTGDTLTTVVPEASPWTAGALLLGLTAAGAWRRSRR